MLIGGILTVLIAGALTYVMLLSVHDGTFQMMFGFAAIIVRTDGLTFHIQSPKMRNTRLIL